MSINRSVPDYELADTVELTTAEQVRAISDPLRTTLLGLLHERAATVTELATAVGRPKSTVAHHVKVLADAGILQVVRTRRVRAIEERFYGRAARMFFVGLGRAGRSGPTAPRLQRFRGRGRGVETGVRRGSDALVHPARPHPRGACRGVLAAGRRADPHVRPIPRADTTYGFTVGLYPIGDYPTLPPADDEA